ncbi:pre-B-cell leukemia homeobox interacting protein 1b isoform X2 [Pleuronectes platessa]|uniref:pre-B-cell leukemia homeobox interacting protein 1b isoform X2 n=1 Tax=Pleuronectes platessa TaxID=8262 RepID=UPI00232A60E4|nr:pre-B-cell leukemia homeobox interacting protein 1b isoform X2 [Pleuronectes platessa]XP_053288479.1 pre-B-cell leukemia homeobox interacting protein 1b isoform X2 [Pleuronectes platessa]
MSGSNSANSSWTVLTPETVAETLKPLAEETENHEESLTSAAEPESGANQAARGEASTEGSPVEEHLVSGERTVELIGDTSTEQQTSVPPALSDAAVPASLEDSGSSVPGRDALDHSQAPPEGPAPSSPDPDSFCDSYTHITPSPDEPPASLLTTETLGGGEFTQEQEEERLAEEGTVHHINGVEIQQEDESDLSPRTSDLGKQADSPVDSEVGEERTERKEEEAEPEVRRRRTSLLAALDRIGRTEEEEEREEEFQVPQRDDDSGFSVNKCMLGAVILLGLGTIFFSGVFMDLDEESDYGTRELRDSEAPGKQEWLNPEVPPPPVDADSTELLNKLAEENQQISLLQAQFQAEQEELNVAKGQAAEGATERLQWEEVEKEHSRLKTEMASLPVLQKENDKMKRELESVLALQKELETLRSTGTELKRSPEATEAAQAPVQSTTSPSSGQPEESRQETTKEREDKKPLKDQKEKKTDWKKEKYDTGEKKEWKEREKFELKEGENKERKDGGKTEWKKGKHEQGKSDKVKDKEGKQERHSDVTKQYKEKKNKKEKVSRGDERKSWKVSEGNKEWIEMSERKNQKEVKDWKKTKHEKVNEGKQEKKDRKRGKDQGEKHKGREEWNGEKEWKKGKDGFKESGKDKWEMKDGKEKSEKKDGEWRAKNGKEGRRKDDRKQWEERENHSRNHGKDRKMKDEKKQWKENEWKGKDDKEWKKKDEKKQREKEGEWKRGQKEKDQNYDKKKVKSSSHRNEDEHHHGERVRGEGKAAHTHRSPPLEQPEYWVQQRDRLQHKTKPPQNCNSLETCAQSEGLLPVPLPEFEAILQTYLAKAEEAGVDASKIEELRKLAPEFFKDGVFAHDQMSFQEFVEDVGDILEDMVEGEENGYDTDSEIEEEMEEFERDVIKKFSVPKAAEKAEGIQREKRKENGRGRG